MVGHALIGERVSIRCCEWIVVGSLDEPDRCWLACDIATRATTLLTFLNAVLQSWKLEVDGGIPFLDIWFLVNGMRWCYQH